MTELKHMAYIHEKEKISRYVFNLKLNKILPLLFLCASSYK